MRKKCIFVQLCICMIFFLVTYNSHADTVTEKYFGIIYDGEDFERIEYPGANGTFIHDINNSGVVVGRYLRGTTSYGFVYDGVNFQDIIPPGAATCSAEGINTRGDIVGWYDEVDGVDEVRHGFLLPAGSETFELIHYPGQEAYALNDINDSGVIIGWYYEIEILHGFLYDGVSFLKPIDYPYSTATTLASINDSGEITGFYTDGSEASEQGVCVFDSDGNDYSLKYQGADRTGAGGISNSGDVAGWYVLDGDRHGFVYDGESYRSISYPGITDTKLTGINSSGVVVGTGAEIVVDKDDEICFIQSLLD